MAKWPIGGPLRLRRHGVSAGGPRLPHCLLRVHSRAGSRGLQRCDRASHTGTRAHRHTGTQAHRQAPAVKDLTVRRCGRWARAPVHGIAARRWNGARCGARARTRWCRRRPGRPAPRRAQSSHRVAPGSEQVEHGRVVVVGTANQGARRRFMKDRAAWKSGGRARAVMSPDRTHRWATVQGFAVLTRPSEAQAGTTPAHRSKFWDNAP